MNAKNRILFTLARTLSLSISPPPPETGIAFSVRVIHILLSSRQNAPATAAIHLDSESDSYLNSLAEFIPSSCTIYVAAAAAADDDSFELIKKTHETAAAAATAATAFHKR